MCKKIVWFVVFCILFITGETFAGSDKKLLVIGIDGMDPVLLQQYIDEKKMPNVKQLIDNGGDFKKLGTSYPPQSPVAWSNFAVSGNPGVHGIFDFIHRHASTLTPYLSTTETGYPSRFLRFGKWQFPLNQGIVRNLRQGTPFWEYLDRHGVDARVLKLPGNYPCECPCQSGRIHLLSGMGTPDILGTQGTFSFYTTYRSAGLKETIGGGRIYSVELKDGKCDAVLYGPQHPYINPLKCKSLEESSLKTPFTVYVDSVNDVAKIVIGDQEIILNQGEFSDFVKVRFSILPFLQSMSAICRFYLKECHPHFKLYVSPLNIDPSDPAMPISAPATYAEELFKAIGFFYTQNMPPDTKALEHGILTDDEFLEQMHLVFEEEKRSMFHELNRFDKGVQFHYFNILDQTCHTFWRAMDSAHPLYTEELGAKYGKTIENLYREFDQVIGKVMEITDNDTAVVIMSDHGFTSFRRGVNLNTLLLKNGFIALIDPSIQGETEFFENVDWDRTRAYNLGINAVYINLFEREPNGVVLEEEYDDVCEEIRTVLLSFVDPQTGRHPIKHVARREEIYSGPNVVNAPDLIIGYEDGYRASWETILGKIPKETVVDNVSPWSGDHCVYFGIVPGIVVSNRKISLDNPTLIDIAPAILKYYGIDTEKTEMEGKPLF